MEWPIDASNAHKNSKRKEEKKTLLPLSLLFLTGSAMTRKKVKLAYITNDSARKATFKKRKKGLVKKVSELSALCGVEACAIIYSPYENQPELWPSPMGVQRVLQQFRRMPEMEQSKKMVNQEGFLRQRIVKGSEQLKKQRKENRQKEVTHVMYQGLIGKSLQNLTMMDLNDLGWLIDHNLKEINKQIEVIKNLPQGSLAATGPAVPPAGAAGAGAGASSSTFVPAPIEQEPAAVQIESQQQAVEANMENMKKQQWFMDVMNPQQDPAPFAGDVIFSDPNHNAMWSNSFFH